MRARPFVILYLLSGAAALLYEIAWLRLLTLSMGHTTAAVGTVLAAFMGGLAAGAWIAGLTTRDLAPGRALRIYAALECAVALCALAMPLALGAMRPLLAAAYANGTGGAWFDFVRLAVSVVLIGMPAMAMGASFPIGVMAVRDAGLGARDSHRSQAGELYAANTVGAAIGATLTGFVLLPSLGLFGTTLVGVVLNGIAAAGAIALSTRTLEPALRPNRLNPSNRRTPEPSNHRHVILAAATLSISGFVALVYEVAWTRVLAMTLGPTTYAFSAMLVAFVAGLAIGSALAATRAARLRRPGMWLGVAMIVSAAAALIAASRVDRLPLTIAATAGRADANFTSVFGLQVALAIVMQLPMTIALGATFPLAMAMASRDGDREEHAAAIVYGSNTVGAIAGALAGSFILVPRLGLQSSIQLASTVAVLAGAFIAMRSVSTAPRLRGSYSAQACLAIAAAAVVAFAFVSPRWNQALLANGAYRFAPALAGGDIETALTAGELTYYREGGAGTVSVRRLLGVTSLAIDGKVDASNSGDMLTQKLLAHLPLLLHDNPHSVYIIGLGSGVTLGAALRHPIDRAVVSEISPEVVAASNAFVKENHNALRDPRTRLIVGDGRSHLQLSDDKYDVIVSEPSNPWMAGVSSLFTREFFATARSRLQQGGILCQWAHTYNLSDADLRSIVATFLSVFPDGSAWLVGESDVLLLGSTQPLRAFDGGVETAWNRPGVAADLAPIEVGDPFSVLTLFVARGRDLQRYAAGAAMQSDDRLALEYSAPRAIYGRYLDTNIARLRDVASHAQRPPAVEAVRAAATAVRWRGRAAMNTRADSLELAYQDLLEALKLAPEDEKTLTAYVDAAAASHLDAAERYLRDRAAHENSAAVETELSRVLETTGDTKGAIDAAQRGAALDPANERALGQFVTTLAEGENDAALASLCTLLMQAKPNRPVTTYCAMRLAALHGDFAHSAALGEQLMAANGDPENAARDWNLIGIAYENAGDFTQARRAFAAALAIAPRGAAALLNLAYADLKAGDAAAAETRFSEALFVYPTLKPALDGLTQALDQQGKTSRAAAIRAINH